MLLLKLGVKKSGGKQQNKYVSENNMRGALLMIREELFIRATWFRKAIEKAKDAVEFVPQRFKPERMNNFPHECCDGTTDLFTHYLYQ